MKEKDQMKKMNIYIALVMIVTILTVSACQSSPVPTETAEKTEPVITTESEEATTEEVTTEQSTTKEPTTEEPTTTEAPKQVLENVLLRINTTEEEGTPVDNFGQREITRTFDDEVILEYDLSGKLIGISAHDQYFSRFSSDRIDKATAIYDDEKLIEIQYIFDDSEIGKCTYEYNEQGQLIKQTDYGHVGGAFQAFDINEFCNAYDSLTFIGSYSGADSGNSELPITRMVEFSYNADGTMAQKVVTDSFDTYTYTFVYENGQLKCDGQYNYFYDDSGRVVEKNDGWFYDGSGRVGEKDSGWDHKITYEYNDNDLIIKSTHEAPTYVITLELEYVYGDYEITE